MRVFSGTVGSAGLCRGRQKPSALRGDGKSTGSLARTLQLSQLPDHHRDPFDRMLIAQAMAEPMFLLTSDRALAGYGELVRVV